MTAIEGQIAQEEAQKESKREGARAVFEEQQVIKDALIRSERAIRELFPASFNPMFNDDGKMEIVRDFLVMDMGLKSVEDIHTALRKMIGISRRQNDKNMSDFDKLFGLIMQEKAMRDASLASQIENEP